MRTILLSFKPNVFSKIETGEQKYEYRKVFPREIIRAYAYVSSPEKSIKGILYLDKPQLLKELNLDIFNDEHQKNIISHMKDNNYMMNIIRFQKIESISLEELREYDNDFVVPQMYYYLDELPLFEYLKRRTKVIGNVRINKFD